MPDETTKEVIKPKDAGSANKWLVDFLQDGLKLGRREVEKVQLKLKRTYNVIVVLSIIMFAVGVILLLVPVIDALLNPKEDTDWKSLVVGGLGIADLAALFFFRPIERIHNLMGDMTQITLEVNSYQTQVGLRLLEIDSTNRESFGKAADFVKVSAQNSIETIQKYFEAKE